MEPSNQSSKTIAMRNPVNEPFPRNSNGAKLGFLSRVLHIDQPIRVRFSYFQCSASIVFVGGQYELIPIENEMKMSER